MSNQVKIIILAAGKGTRMESDGPKALAPFKGKPLLHHILETVKKLDPTIKPVIVVGHKQEQIREKFGDGYTYAEQHEQLGTGHAVMSAKNAVGDECEMVLVLYADQPLISKETLKRIIEKHKEKKPAVTLATVMVSDFEDWKMGLNHYGRIVRGDDGLIKDSIEFKDANDKEREIKELNPCLYVFDAKWLWENLKKINKKNAQGEYYLTDLVPIAFKNGDKIESVEMDSHEALGANSQKELEVLEKVSDAVIS